jgi:mannose-1-phosphate guanylyltransferase
MIHAVIMAGGRGERFWPLSRLKTPKQLLRILGDKTLLEQTVARLKPIVPESRIWVVTNEEQAPAIRKLLPRLPGSHILKEPVGRNTAPCIALAAYIIAGQDPDSIMVVLPADHIVSPRKKFQQILRSAIRAARRGDSLITIGIKPGFPATGYGYIKRGRKIVVRDSHSFYRVEKFIEKPDLTRARRFLRSQFFSWNSGMFVWSVPAICRALQQHLPEVAASLKPVSLLPERKRKKFLAQVYPRLPSVSVDYGVMEKHQNVLVTSADFAWDDVGSWEALKNHLPKDSADNQGEGEFVARDTSDCIAVSTGPLIGLVGVTGLIVAATEDAVLVCSRDKAQDVKKLVQFLRKKPKYRIYV